MAAEKVLGFRIEVRGTDKQTSEMAKLNAETIRMRKTVELLNKIEKQNGTLTAKQTNQRQLLSTQIKANAYQYNQLNKQVLQNNNVVQKNESFTKKMGKSIISAGTAMFGIGAAITAVTALIGSAIKTVIDYSKENSKLEAVLKSQFAEMKDNGVSAMKALTDQSKKLGGSTAFTATEVAKLQVEYAKLGFPTTDILNMTEATLNGAAALGSDLAEQAAFTGATLKQYGLDATDATRVNDVMAEAASRSALDFSKLSTALPIVGATANAVGVDLERTTALLGTLADRGLDASTSGTSLRNVFLELSKQGLTYDQAMAKINSSSDKAKTSMELFGKRGATTGLILAETGATIEQLEGQLNDAEGAAKAMADTMLDNLAGDVTIAKSAWEGFILAIEDGEGIFSKVSRGATQMFTNIITGITDLLNFDFNNFADGLDSYIKALTGINVELDKVTPAVDSLTVHFSKLNSSQLANIETEKAIIEQYTKVGLSVEDATAKYKELVKAQDLVTASSKESAKAAENAEIKRQEDIAAAKELADEKAKVKAEAKAKKAREKELEEAKKQAEALEKIKRDGERKALEQLLQLNRIHYQDERKEALNQLDIQFQDKIAKITGDSEVEKQLRIALETQLRKAKQEKQAEFDEEDAQKNIEERELELANKLIKAEEDLEAQRLVFESQRILELSNKELTAAQIDAINLKYDKKQKDIDKQKQEDKKRLLEGDLQAAMGLADALSGLAKEGSAEAKALATGAALINTYLAISGALANAAKLGPFAVAAQVAAAAAIGFAQVKKINSTKTFQDGGLVEGKSHAEGGIQMFHKSGQHIGEMEGNEYIFSRKSVERIGVDKLDAMNFGGGTNNGFFANGGSVPTPTGSQAIRGVINEQENVDRLASILAEEMQQTIIRTPVVNTATDTFNVAANVINTETSLNFG